MLLDNTSEQRVSQFLPFVPPGMTFTYGIEEGEDYRTRLIADADYAITGQVAVTKRMLQAATRLKLVHKSGVGVDNIDIDTARDLGIRVARTTGSNAVPVAEFALGLALSAMRGIAHGNSVLKGGEWRGPAGLPNKTFLISGKTVGIIGFGAIGQAFARILNGFGCSILYNQRSRLPAERERELNATYASLDEIYAGADLISLNCPLTPQTKNMIDRQASKR